MRANNGFTLLELIISLAIMAILLGLAISLNSHLIAYYRRDVAAKTLLSALNAARSAAMSRGRVVTLCPSEDRKTCDGDWSHRLLVFIDTAATGEVVSDDAILHVYNKLAHGQLELHAFPTSRYFRFAPNSFSDNQNGRFTFCYKGKGWQLIVNRLGRIRLEQKPTCVLSSNA